MDTDNNNLAIIFHSGSYDRVLHGLTVALTALAMGRSATVLFTYWSLEYISREKPCSFHLDEDAARYRDIIKKNLDHGHMGEIHEMITQFKILGGRLYVCVGSMSLLNIQRGEFVEEVDASTGMVQFLQESEKSQLIFI